MAGFHMCLGKEVNMVYKLPYSCKSQWTVRAYPSHILFPTQVNITLCRKSPVVPEKPSYWQQYSSTNFAQFLKYFVLESVHHP